MICTCQLIIFHMTLFFYGTVTLLKFEKTVILNSDPLLNNWYTLIHHIWFVDRSWWAHAISIFDINPYFFLTKSIFRRTITVSTLIYYLYLVNSRSSTGQSKKAAFTRGISTFDGKEVKQTAATKPEKKEVEKLIEAEKREKGKVGAFIIFKSIYIYAWILIIKIILSFICRLWAILTIHVSFE